MTAPKWAYACTKHKDGVHTWRRTGEREEVGCTNCGTILTKEESRDLGLMPCNHHWQYIPSKVIPYSTLDTPIECKAVVNKRCIICGA